MYNWLLTLSLVWNGRHVIDWRAMHYPELNNYIHMWELPSEIWKDIETHVGKYQVSSLGRVRRLAFEKQSRNQSTTFTLKLKPLIMKVNPDSKGYSQVTLGSPRRVCRVHRLVAETFLEKPTENLVNKCKEAGLDYVQVNHKDFNRCNPNLNNLEWCSPVENYAHSKDNIENGYRKNTGQLNCNALLTNKDVLEIVELLNTKKYSQEVLAKMFGVKQITISNINTGKSWTHLTGKTRSRKSKRKGA